MQGVLSFDDHHFWITYPNSVLLYFIFNFFFHCLFIYSLCHFPGRFWLILRKNLLRRVGCSVIEESPKRKKTSHIKAVQKHVFGEQKPLNRSLLIDWVVLRCDGANFDLFHWLAITTLHSHYRANVWWKERLLMCCVTVGCSGVIDIAFVLHSGGTVHPERWRYVTQFVINILEQLDVHRDRTRVAAITWSDSAHIAFALNQFTSRQDVKQVIFTYLYTDSEKVYNQNA